jgi:hypothetical protein
MPDIDSIRGRAHILGTGCHWRAYGHDLSYGRWRLLGSGLGILVAVSSAIAGSTLLASKTAGHGWALVAGIVGLLGAVLAAASKVLDADARALAHRSARAAFIGLRTDYYSLSTPMGNDDPALAKIALNEIEERHKRVELESEPPERWADTRATKKYEALT